VLEVYEKAEIEAALTEHGFSIQKLPDSFYLYQNHNSPGYDVMLYWSEERYEWEDLKDQLEDQGIDPESIHNTLKLS